MKVKSVEEQLNSVFEKISQTNAKLTEVLGDVNFIVNALTFNGANSGQNWSPDVRTKIASLSQHMRDLSDLTKDEPAE